METNGLAGGLGHPTWLAPGQQVKRTVSHSTLFVLYLILEYSLRIIRWRTLSGITRY